MSSQANDRLIRTECHRPAASGVPPHCSLRDEDVPRLEWICRGNQELSFGVGVFRSSENTQGHVRTGVPQQFQKGPVRYVMKGLAKAKVLVLIFQTRRKVPGHPVAITSCTYVALRAKETWGRICIGISYVCKASERMAPGKVK